MQELSSLDECSFFQEVLGQCLVISLPDPLLICQDSPDDDSLKEMDKLLLLILGAAVQCSQKEHIIDSIKNLDFELQHAFVEKIREVGTMFCLLTVRGKKSPSFFDGHLEQKLHLQLRLRSKCICRHCSLKCLPILLFPITHGPLGTVTLLHSLRIRPWRLTHGPLGLA